MFERFVYRNNDVCLFIHRSSFIIYHKSIDIYTFSKNVQNAIYAGGFKHKKHALFKVIVTNIFSDEKVVTVIFLAFVVGCSRPSEKWTFFWTFILSVMIW